MARNCADPAFRPTTTIADGGTNSTYIDITALNPRGLAILVPDSWTDADIYFEVTDDDPDDSPTWSRLKDEFQTVVKITNIDTTDGALYIAPSQVWAVGAFPYLRLVSSAAQTGAKTLTVCILG